MKKPLYYETPQTWTVEGTVRTVLCSSTGSTINDLVEDDQTLGGLFD